MWRLAIAPAVGAGCKAGTNRAVLRPGGQCRADLQEMRVAVRNAEVAWMDETGWRVAATLRWLWGVVTETVTVYDILPGRGFNQAASMLGADWEGWLHHDGWRVYYQFLKAIHLSSMRPASKEPAIAPRIGFVLGKLSAGAAWIAIIRCSNRRNSSSSCRCAATTGLSCFRPDQPGKQIQRKISVRPRHHR